MPLSVQMELSSFGAFLAPSNESLLPPDAGNATAPGQEEHHHFAPLGPVPVLQIPTFALSIFYLIVTLTVIVQIVLNLYYKYAPFIPLVDSILRRWIYGPTSFRSVGVDSPRNLYFRV